MYRWFQNRRTVRAEFAVIGNWIENKYLASQQKEMEQKNLELLNYEGNPKDTSDEYTDTDFMRKILKCVANSWRLLIP